jgi:periplasmic copper chaperone A
VQQGDSLHKVTFLSTLPYDPGLVHDEELSMNRRIAGLCIGAMLTVASSAVALAGGVQATDAYVRATPPGMTMTAAYMVLTNRGSDERRLVAVSSPVAARVELHENVEADGMAQMRKIEHVVLPAGGEVALQEGGMHVMLMGLERSLSPGEQVDLVLEFADGERIEVDAQVRRAGHAGHGRH